ncbi:MAG: TonB-dependent receptor [Burkholderiaceae bacterium]|nr:TonB-dependent receptor [Burkholderiaceae bacterium]
MPLARRPVLRPCPVPLHRIAAAAALAGAQLGASAQQATATDAATAAEPGKLPTVTVTAERRYENIRDVPNSVSTIGAELLDTINTGGQDLRGISGRVPSLNIESSFGRAFPRFYIRGYGNTDFRLNASQPVSLIYDDVVQENPILKGFPAFDLARIEVLRGPQGTLFGRNTPAGVVKFESVRPTRKFEGYGSLAVGSFRTINAEGALNVPTGPDSALRVSLLNQTRKDWVHNTNPTGLTQDFEGYRDSAGRVQWLFAPHKDFEALANVHARDLNGSARLFRANIIQPGTNDLVAGFDERSVTNDGKNEQTLTNVGANLRLRWGLGGDLSLHSITGYEHVKAYSRGDIDGGTPGPIPFSSETADGMPKHRQITQEFRVESSYPGPLNWQGGLYVFHEDYKVESFSFDTPNGSAQDGYQRVRQKNDAYAVFGAVNYAVTPELKLRGGIRYTRDEKQFDVEDYSNSGFAACVGPTLGILPPPIRCTFADLLAAEGPGGSLSASPRDSKVNWDLSGTYALSKALNLYARVATGFRASSVQGASAFNFKSVASPETNTSYEAGVKADLLDGRARVNFGVFYYNVKDLQFTAVGGAANANILLNAKKATGQGFELDGQAYLTENLLATLGVGYNDTKIKDPNLEVAGCGSVPACTMTDPTGPNGGRLVDGNPLPQAPKTTVNLTLRYGQPIGAGEWYVLTDWVYRSKINFFIYESVEFTGKPLTEGGLRLGYLWGNGKYEAAAYVRNITNQIRVVGGIDFNNLTGFINEPRTYGVQLKAAF